MSTLTNMTDVELTEHYYDMAHLPLTPETKEHDVAYFHDVVMEMAARFARTAQDKTEEEQEPKKGHWINKNHLFESCSAECSSCHERSNGYIYDNGFSLECKYYDFCPKCGADMRGVEK